MSTSTRTAAAPDPVVSDLIGSGVEGGVGDQVRAWLQRVRGGEMGALPAVGGLVLLVILFSILSRFFFTPVNFANLMSQAASLVVLGMALVFVLLLGEIDLSAGVTGGVGIASFVVLNVKLDIPWPIALGLGLLIGLATGALIGFLVARIGIPSFVVTLGLFLGYQGLALLIIGAGGLYPIEAPELLALDDALTELEKLDPRQAKVVELRFFAGLSVEETAEVTGISTATVKREWKTARAFLRHEINLETAT